MSNNGGVLSKGTQILKEALFIRDRNATDNKPRQKFHYVVCGVLVLASVAGTVVFGGNTTHASPVNYDTVGGVVAQGKDSVNSRSFALDAGILNLRQANKALQATIKSGEFSYDAYDGLTKALMTIEYNLSQNEEADMEVFKPLVEESDKLLYVTLPSDIAQEVITSRSESMKALKELQNRLGVKPKQAGGIVRTDIDKSLLSEVNIAAAPEAYKAQLPAKTAAATSGIKVIIDGKVQTYSQPPVMQSNTVLVPMRGIFESLGAKVNYVAATKTVTAVKGDTTVTLVLGKKEAVVNGKKVQLQVAANAVKGNTMVPLRFVSEALGAKVDWNQTSQTVTITSGTGSVETPTKPGTGGEVTLEQSPTNKYAVSVPKSQWQEVTVMDYKFTGKGYVTSNPKKIKVEFGDHTYGAQNQEEYDYIMKNVKESLDELFKPGGEYEQAISPAKSAVYRQAYNDYKNGVRAADVGRTKGEEYVIALLSMEGRGALIDNGVELEEIIKFDVMRKVYSKYDSVSKDPLDGSPRSAYDMIKNKVTDCDPQSYIITAIMDYMGYNSATFSGMNHADPVAQVQGKWYVATNLTMSNVRSYTYKEIKEKGLSNSGKMLEQATYPSKA